SGSLLVNWSTDDSWKYRMFSRLIGTEWDLAVTTYPDAVPWYQCDGINGVMLSQWAANDETLLPPLPAIACRYSVSFIGAAYGNRPAMIEALRREGIEVNCFGHGWPGGPVEAKQIAEIVRASKISLNFSEGSQQGTGGAGGRQIKARVFEVPGYGGCLLTEQAPSLEKYFRIGEEILTFESRVELVGAIKSLLADPDRRDAIARRGFERVSREHTYERRFNELLGTLSRQVVQRRNTAIDWPTFDVAARRHRFGPALKLLRSMIVTIASLFWGRQRGPRAARRIVFELSWRFFGAHTYSAAGWPGRMFYRES
ncbi:CgeB family protein, partial [Petrachloros mirabilis]